MLPILCEIYVVQAKEDSKKYPKYKVKSVHFSDRYPPKIITALLQCEYTSVERNAYCPSILFCFHLGM